MDRVPWSVIYPCMVAAVFGCSGPEGGESDTDPSDPDTTDTDAPALLDGQLVLRRTVDGVTVCDFDVEFRDVAAYTGDCPGCDFAFSIESRISTERTPCQLESWDSLYFALLETSDYPDAWMGWSSAFQYDGYIYGDVLAIGYSEDDYGYYELMTGSYEYDGYTYSAGYGSSTFDGVALSWTLEDERSTWVPNWEDPECSRLRGNYGTTQAAGAPLVETLPCADGSALVDVYDIVSEVAGTLRISVDYDAGSQTLGAGRFLYITDGDGCIVGEWASEGLTTYELPLLGADVYHVIVDSRACLDEAASELTYVLRAEGAASVQIAEGGDDAERGHLEDVTVTTVSGTATLHP